MINRFRIDMLRGNFYDHFIMKVIAFYIHDIDYYVEFSTNLCVISLKTVLRVIMRCFEFFKKLYEIYY